MTVEQLQSPYVAARTLLNSGETLEALKAAELAVDEFWKYGDERITQALPLLSMLCHASGVHDDLFRSLEDMPATLADRLYEEAAALNRKCGDDASARMMVDVSSFMTRWVGFKPAGAENPEIECAGDDEKIVELSAQIKKHNAAKERDLAVETSLELANEYAIRGKNAQANRMFVQVIRKSKRPGRTALRIDGLLDYGQFMMRLGKLDDAERVLRLASGVAKKARDKDRYSTSLAWLGTLLMHSQKNEQAKKYLEKAKSLLNAWDVETDMVRQHLESLADGVACDCPKTSGEPPRSGTKWA